MVVSGITKCAVNNELFYIVLSTEHFCCYGTYFFSLIDFECFFFYLIKECSV